MSRQATCRKQSDEPTRTWGFNGDHLGPTLRAKRGERVVVNVANGLAEPTSVHWHGMHLGLRLLNAGHSPAVYAE
jgi:FtsP/CotA-like multicopper oxidase with cupredoxin domain